MRSFKSVSDKEIISVESELNQLLCDSDRLLKGFDDYVYNVEMKDTSSFLRDFDGERLFLPKLILSAFHKGSQIDDFEVLSELISEDFVYVSFGKDELQSRAEFIRMNYNDFDETGLSCDDLDQFIYKKCSESFYDFLGDMLLKFSWALNEHDIEHDFVDMRRIA